MRPGCRDARVPCLQALLDCLEPLLAQDRGHFDLDPLLTRSHFSGAAVAASVIVATCISFAGQNRIDQTRMKMLIAVCVAPLAQPFHDRVDAKRLGLAVTFEIEPKD
ncbi:hypothetical protein AOA14_11185 [Sphingopyxis terrae subsp. terrae NBRC 15098]|uniref:Uncharacterized protein n=1 Tax=Sphingopyxis terrae subsp. terrae NBRC 15098 TaxID=1219058 RepID=A0A142VZL6_9SPHN|nr:hypothetical protein AOA14_11185 [Sphingopyxis terrae subsp. terrae NBRC 15098]